MPNVVEYGYLDRPYLEDPYITGVVDWGVWCQVEMRIDTTNQVKSQVARTVDNATHNVSTQIDRRVDNVLKLVREQSTITVGSTHTARSQVARLLTQPDGTYEQVDRLITTGLKRQHQEIRRGSVLFIDHCEGYLDHAYLEDDYLVDTMCAKMRSQVARKLGEERNYNSQVELVIRALHTVREQIEQRIDDTRSIPEQVDRLRSYTMHSQITQVLYNTDNLRVLCDFASRGVTGINWTANSTEPGDFSVNNLNTDIVEQVWRSASGVTTGLILTVDTEIAQGVFVDTLAILGHNMTTSASLVWIGSNDPGFSSIGFTEVLPVTRTNVFWISPSLPTTSFRYWRFLLSDGTNTADYIQWGTVVFGSASIFQGENFVDRVIRQTTHFSDKIETEGFTNVSNDRALKFSTTLEFRNLAYNKGNYNRLREIFEDDRTSLKCLWIPTPRFPARFAVFGKLTAIPAETHNVKGEFQDYVDMELTVDEAL